MKRLWFLVAALLILAACGGQTVQDSADVESVETEVVDSAEIEIESEPETEVVEAYTMPSADIDLTAPVEPTSDSAVAGIIRDRDWTKGSDDPMVTIIEYGDFQ